MTIRPSEIQITKESDALAPGAGSTITFKVDGGDVYWLFSEDDTFNFSQLTIEPTAPEAGKVSVNSGTLILLSDTALNQPAPEVGDEVLVGFEYGDPHRPYEGTHAIYQDIFIPPNAVEDYWMTG